VRTNFKSLSLKQAKNESKEEYYFGVNLQSEI